MGSSTSSVVPGQVVDSSTTSWPARSQGASASAVRTTNDRSGSRSRVSGVGTQMTAASQLRHAGEVGRRGEPAAAHRLGDGGPVDVLDVAAPLGDGARLRRVDVDAERGEPAGAEKVSASGSPT